VANDLTECVVWVAVVVVMVAAYDDERRASYCDREGTP
jgi:hypothetical protein